MLQPLLGWPLLTGMNGQGSPSIAAVPRLGAWLHPLCHAPQCPQPCVGAMSGKDPLTSVPSCTAPGSAPCSVAPHLRPAIVDLPHI